MGWKKQGNPQAQRQIVVTSMLTAMCIAGKGDDDSVISVERSIRTASRIAGAP